MTRRRLVPLLIVSLVVVLAAGDYIATRVVRQQRLAHGIRDLQDQAAALAGAAKFDEAANKLDELQVLYMNAGRYQEALDTAFRIEDVSLKASNRRSPWNYVKIAEAYLGMGNWEQYLGWMEKAVYERGFTKLDYFQDARLGAFRDDPRFKKLVETCSSEIGVGRMARDFHVTLLDGSSFALSEQLGNVVLIDFWDVQCGPCRKEMPNLKEILRDFGGRSFVILGISLDTDKKLLDDYLREAALPWKIACSFEGWNDSTAKLYKINATPSTWLIDRHGVVRYNDVSGEALRRAVDELTRE